MSESNSPSSYNPNDAQHPSVSANTAQLNSRQVSEIEPWHRLLHGAVGPHEPPLTPRDDKARPRLLHLGAHHLLWHLPLPRSFAPSQPSRTLQHLLLHPINNVTRKIHSPPKAAGNQAMPRGTPYARPEQPSSLTRKGLCSASHRSRPSAGLRQAWATPQTPQP
ncbi:hypothetical protein Q8A67_018809 [Cirrhinus molitorella]|uniref:Uncharacterized protein n=1 Tax=Cirrhinus molitorella TaxID=172907 RepID=A0AA88PH17_9TELE|nr:hypothetical protein Q8A67_018809 [Cirrhinus molitorella]